MIAEYKGDTNGDIPDLSALWHLLSEDERATIEAIVEKYRRGESKVVLLLPSSSDSQKAQGADK